MYNVGEEIKVSNSGIRVGGHKPTCLYLAKVLSTATGTQENSFTGVPRLSNKTGKLSCGGCDSGTMDFEYRKEKDFATLQMKLLNEAEEKRRKQHLDKFFHILRSLPIFEPLDDDPLAELTLLLELKSIPIDKVIVKKNDTGPGLFILLKGKVSVLNDDGTRQAVLKNGDVFGEMSLLSGEPVTNSIHTIEPSHVALLSVKNFKQVIIQYPVLQIFLFKMLVERAQSLALQSGNITSGMSGELEEISVVDLLQLIHSSQKTGTIELLLANGKANTYFVDGQIVDAEYLGKDGKDAFYQIIGVKTGRFSYSKGIPDQIRGREPLGDFMALLMEGLQKIDES